MIGYVTPLATICEWRWGDNEASFEIADRLRIKRCYMWWTQRT
jgi:hypothetical protein